MRARSAGFLLPPQNNLHRLNCRPPIDMAEEIQPAPPLAGAAGVPLPRVHALNEILGDMSDEAVAAKRAIMLLNVSDEIHCNVVATLVRLRDEPIEHHVLSPQSVVFEMALSSIAARASVREAHDGPRTVVVSWGAQGENCALAYDRLIPTLEKLLLLPDVRLIVTTAATYCLDSLLCTLRSFAFAGVAEGPQERFGTFSRWHAAPVSWRSEPSKETPPRDYILISREPSCATTATLHSGSTLGLALRPPMPIALRAGQRVRSFTVQNKGGPTTLTADELKQLLLHTLVKPRSVPVLQGHHETTTRAKSFAAQVQRGQEMALASGAQLLIVGGQVNTRRNAARLIAGVLPTATHDFSMLLTAAWSPPVGVGLSVILEHLTQSYRSTGRKICLVFEGLFSNLNEVEADLEFFRNNAGWGYRNATDFFEYLTLYPHIFHVVALEAHRPLEGQASFENVIDLATLPVQRSR